MPRTARIAALIAALAVAIPAASEPLVPAKAGKKSASVRRSRAAAPKPSAAPLDFDAVNNPANATVVARGASRSAVLRAQVLLDRARFSPGEIDGAYGMNVQKGIAGFQKARGIEPTGVVGPRTWKLLNADSAPALVRYAITAQDVAGPFQTVPEDMMEKATLPALGYANALEELSERFHSSPKLLSKLNPGKSFDRVGEKIVVPNVRAGAPPKAARVVVDASERTVTALDAGEKPLAQYPATVGSEYDPLPVGNWKINGVSKNPRFHYNPDLFWDAEAQDEKTTLQPGPNNPVGVVWIDLSKPHYGIHGTPEPSTIGKTQSHGCIRLTNWDAAELAEMVAPGIPAILQE
jgi:lipoprotein-anchoring transpeptidase ErfK/SrfK